MLLSLRSDISCTKGVSPIQDAQKIISEFLPPKALRAITIPVLSGLTDIPLACGGLLFFIDLLVALHTD
jgi:hypothetical protein